MNIVASAWVPPLIALGLFGGLFLATEAGYRFGRRQKRGEADRGQAGAVQGALLGLLGLLLGFSFAGASSRFIERQQLIVREANTLGTAYLRAELLAEPHRGELKAVLREYTDVRLALGYELDRGRAEEIGRRMTALHARLWSAARIGAEMNPAITMAILPPVNEIIDQYGERRAALRRHLPPLVVGLLIASAALATFAIGFGNGLSGKRHTVMTLSFTILAAVTLWTTIDLDFPRRGVIRVDPTPLEEARAGME